MGDADESCGERPTGRPLMLFNSEGKTVWRPGQTSLWGLALSLPADTGYPDPRGELDPEADPGLLYAGTVAGYGIRAVL